MTLIYTRYAVESAGIEADRQILYSEPSHFIKKWRTRAVLNTLLPRSCLVLSVLCSSFWMEKKNPYSGSQPISKKSEGSVPSFQYGASKSVLSSLPAIATPAHAFQEAVRETRASFTRAESCYLRACSLG